MFKAYHPRPLRFLGVETVAGHRLKAYSILQGDGPFDRERFAGGLDSTREVLPSPDLAAGRPGLGFVILHQAGVGDYLILGWWDRENELPTKVLINEGDGWRSGEGGESFCVWDLRVIWWEREAYAGTMLAGREDGAEAYLTNVVEGYA